MTYLCNSISTPFAFQLDVFGILVLVAVGVGRELSLVVGVSPQSHAHEAQHLSFLLFSCRKDFFKLHETSVEVPHVVDGLEELSYIVP